MLHTGAGSPTGICVYEGSLLPTSLQGQLLHCDAGPSVTRAYVTHDDGAGYSAEIVNILEGTRDNWFRPTDVKVAPDGSLIVADWYDPGVGGHRMGDVERGRLFRVIPKQHSGRYVSPEFDFSTARGAVAALKNPNNSVRYLAWTALHAMGEKAESALQAVWQNDADARMRARALWLLGKIPGRGLHYVDLASRDKNKDIRCQSLRLARQLDDVDVLPVVARLVEDPQPSVRRECAIALRHDRSDQAAQLWARLAKQHDGKDRWYLEALGIAADGQWDRFLGDWLEMVDGRWNTAAGRDLIWRSRATKTGLWLGEILSDASLSAAELPRYFRAMDFLPKEQREALAVQLAFGKAVGSEARRTLVMREAMRRVPTDVVKSTPKYKQAVNNALDGFAGTADFVNFVSRFEIDARYPQLLALAVSQPGGQLGIEAMRVLTQKGQAARIDAAIRGAEEEVALNLVQAVGNAGDNSGANLLARIANDAQVGLPLRRQAVRSMARINAGAKMLLTQIEQHKMEPALVASASAVLHSSRWRDVREHAQKLMPLPPTKSAEKLPSLPELARMRGDAELGKKVFAGEGTCSKCHIVREEGKEVGPNLTEIGSKLSRQAMFEAILYPSAGISHNYEAYALVTVDGETVTGLLTSKTDEEIAYQQDRIPNDAHEVIITTDDGIARKYAAKDVEALAKQEISLMPADLQKLMTKQELVHVVEYLTTLTKDQ